MKLTLTGRKQETPNVESFLFEPEQPLSWKPGQFLHYVLHHEPTDSRGSDRWFTVSSAPSEGKVMITTRFNTKQSSTFKQALQALVVGESIEISDMQGDGDFIIEESSEKFVFIAGGIGVAPFRSILKEADNAGEKLEVLLLYANNDEHVPYKMELDAFSTRNPKLRIKYVTGKRIDKAVIRESVSDLEHSLFYISGPEPMVDSLGIILSQMGVSNERIKQDWFPGYISE